MHTADLASTFYRGLGILSPGSRNSKVTLWFASLIEERAVFHRGSEVVSPGSRKSRLTPW